MDKKKAIFESTLELVKDNGFHGTPMSLIAKKAGIAAGTIYIYFDSKDELMVELYAYIRTKMVDAMLQNDDEQLPYKERFFNLWLNHCKFYINHPDALCFLEQFTNSPYYLQDNPPKDDERFQKIIKEFTKSGVESGVLKSINYQLLGMIIHGSVISAAKIYLRKIKMSEEELRQVAQIVWDGIKY